MAISEPTMTERYLQVERRDDAKSRADATLVGAATPPHTAPPTSTATATMPSDTKQSSMANATKSSAAKQSGTKPTSTATAAKPSRWQACGKLLAHWCSAAIAGVSALGLVRVLAPFLGFTVKINTASLALSALLGTPGVVLVLLLRLIFLAGG